MERALSMYPSILPPGVAVLPWKVSSGISDQPMGIDATAEGARNRAEAAQRRTIETLRRLGRPDEPVLALGIEYVSHGPARATLWWRWADLAPRCMHPPRLVNLCRIRRPRLLPGACVLLGHPAPKKKRKGGGGGKEPCAGYLFKPHLVLDAPQVRHPAH